MPIKLSSISAPSQFSIGRRFCIHCATSRMKAAQTSGWARFCCPVHLMAIRQLRGLRCCSPLRDTRWRVASIIEKAKGMATNSLRGRPDAETTGHAGCSARRFGSFRSTPQARSERCDDLMASRRRRDPTRAHGAHASGAYSITSVARASTVGGMVRASAFATLRLMTSSNCVGC